MSFILVSYFWELSSADSWLVIITECVCEAPPWSLSPSFSCLFEDTSSWLSAPCHMLGRFFFSLAEILELKLLKTWPLSLALLSPSINHTRLGWAYSAPVKSSQFHTHLCCWGSVTWHMTPLLCLSKKACWFPCLAFFLCGCRSVVFQIPYIQDQKP